MPHFSKPIRFIDQFLARFQPLFSNTQMNIFRQMIYAMFFDYKRLNLSSIAKRTHLDYQKIQYFFSESSWSVEQLNDIRLKILQNQHTTRSTAKGVMAIDDTSVPKPHAEKTEGAQFQYCPAIGGVRKTVTSLSLPALSPTLSTFPSTLHLTSLLKARRPKLLKVRLTLPKTLFSTPSINKSLSQQFSLTLGILHLN
jgi:hypothetical protein